MCVYIFYVEFGNYLYVTIIDLIFPVGISLYNIGKRDSYYCNTGLKDRLVTFQTKAARLI